MLKVQITFDPDRDGPLYPAVVQLLEGASKRNRVTRIKNALLMSLVTTAPNPLSVVQSVPASSGQSVRPPELLSNTATTEISPANTKNTNNYKNLMSSQLPDDETFTFRRK
jgi:uncharacterized membrane protein